MYGSWWRELLIGSLKSATSNLITLEQANPLKFTLEMIGEKDRDSYTAHNSVKRIHLIETFLPNYLKPLEQGTEV